MKNIFLISLFSIVLFSCSRESETIPESIPYDLASPEDQAKMEAFMRGTSNILFTQDFLLTPVNRDLKQKLSKDQWETVNQLRRMDENSLSTNY